MFAERYVVSPRFENNKQANILPFAFNYRPEQLSRQVVKIPQSGQVSGGSKRSSSFAALNHSFPALKAKKVGLYPWHCLRGLHKEKVTDYLIVNRGYLLMAHRAS